MLFKLGKRLIINRHYLLTYHYQNIDISRVTQSLNKRCIYLNGVSNQENQKKITLSEKMEIENIEKKELLFKQMENRNLKTFHEAIEIYLHRNVKYRRHHVELIYAAMKKMEEFSAHKDLASYKVLLDLFPKGKMVPENEIQRDFMHFPKQQQCAIDLMDQMEEEGVMPDKAFGRTLVEIFGKYSYAHRKYLRIMYWMPKFKNITLWPLPRVLPGDQIELAKMALDRMTAVDKRTVISVHRTSEIPDFNKVEEGDDDAVKKEDEDIWIASAQSPVQINLLTNLPPTQHLYINGPFQIYLRTTSLYYFVLRSDRQLPKDPEVEEANKDPDDVANLPVILSESQTKDKRKFEPSVHEQEDGIILACCVTQTSDSKSLSAWLHFLQRDNPTLANRSVVFSLTHFPTAEASLVPSDAKD